MAIFSAQRLGGRDPGGLDTERGRIAACLTKLRRRGAAQEVLQLGVQGGWRIIWPKYEFCYYCCDVDDVQLANYIAGTDPGPVEMWRTDGVTSAALGVPAGTVVWASDYTLNKTKFVHPEITFQDYVMLPDILSSGFIIPGHKRRSIEVCHVDMVARRRRFWCVSIRATSQSETFITMIRRGNLRDVRRKYRKAKRQSSLIRDHSNELARHLLAPRQNA